MIEKENLHQNSGSDSLVLYNRINKDNVNFQTKIFIENKHQYLTRIVRSFMKQNEQSILDRISMMKLGQEGVSENRSISNSNSPSKAESFSLNRQFRINSSSKKLSPMSSNVRLSGSTSTDCNHIQVSAFDISSKTTKNVACYNNALDDALNAFVKKRNSDRKFSASPIVGIHKTLSNQILRNRAFGSEKQKGIMLEHAFDSPEHGRSDNASPNSKLSTEKIKVSAFRSDFNEEGDSDKVPQLSPQKLDPLSTNFYLMNRKKYNPLITKVHSSPGPSSHSQANYEKASQFDLHRLKEELKLSRKIKLTTLESSLNLQKLRNFQSLNAELQRSSLTPEDESKVQILRKKIAITNIFQNENKDVSQEEKKNLYRQMLLEYHPDKSQHSKEISDEIFNFLQINKHSLLGILKA